MMKEREIGMRTRDKLTLAKPSVCLTFFPLPKGVTSTYSLLHHLSTLVPLASQVLKDHWACFHGVVECLLWSSAGSFEVVCRQGMKKKKKKTGLHSEKMSPFEILAKPDSIKEVASAC